MPHLLRLLVLACLVIASAVASEPRQVAEAATAAWFEKDADRLHALGHPELVQRARTARICEFHFRDQPEKLKRLRTGSDADVIALLCEALRAIVPDNKPLVRIHDYEKTELRDPLAIVTFQTGWKSSADGTKAFLTPEQIVLKKSGEEWKFLWSAASIHIDLEWNPLDKPRASSPTAK